LKVDGEEDDQVDIIWLIIHIIVLLEMSLRGDYNHQLAQQLTEGNDSSLLSEFIQVAPAADTETGGSAGTCGD
jgi:hypothetical protein